VSIVTSEPSDSSSFLPRSASHDIRIKLDRARKTLDQATASLAQLESKPFPWVEAKSDEGLTYFYNENTDEFVYKLPPEYAALRAEIKRLQKAQRASQKTIESLIEVYDDLSGNDSTLSPEQNQQQQTHQTHHNQNVKDESGINAAEQDSENVKLQKVFCIS
jgi:hypothetical protein